MNILYIVDTPDWALDNNAKALKKYGHNTYDIRYGKHNKYKTAFNGAGQYDLVIFAVDVRIDRVIREDRSIVPPNKLVILIRSDVFRLCPKPRLHFYKQKGLLKKKVRAFLCANTKMYDKFSTYNNKCFYAPGGVDTDIFRPLSKKKRRSERCRVGWAGSKRRGLSIRGIDKVARACRKRGFRWNPAIKENKNRSQREMARYYCSEIDVYVDASITAGRQNGLLEAAACGIPIACTRVGIGAELIDKGYAVEIKRTIKSIGDAIYSLSSKRGKVDWELVKNIRQKWSWRVHAKLWEEMLKELKGV